MPKHSADMREALIKLFEEPVPETYKTGRQVLQSILGSDNIALDRPVLCFASNLLLTAMSKPGVCPLVWETKARIEKGCKTVLEPMDGAGAELLMEFLGTFVHTRTYSVHTLYLLYIQVHTQYILLNLSTYLYIPSIFM